MERLSTGHNLLPVRQGGDPRGLVNTFARVVALGLRRFGRMEPDPNEGGESVSPPMLVEPPLDAHGAPHRRRRTRERHEEPIAGVIHLNTVMLAEQLPERAVVPAAKAIPGRVPDRSEEVG